mmetsp:Transcript_34235/g.82425  ORF Transcript_34235/g.82425 Transcript_34235/m.82425 type:complete len:373 (-) Transcript_34235:1944-3062(-)
MAPRPRPENHHTYNSSSSFNSFDNTSRASVAPTTFSPPPVSTAAAAAAELSKTMMMGDHHINGKDATSTTEVVVNTTAIKIASNNDDSPATTSTTMKIDSSENSDATTISSKCNKNNEAAVVSGSIDCDTTDTDSSSRVTFDTNATNSHSNSNSNIAGRSTGSGSEILPGGSSNSNDNSDSNTDSRKTFKSSVSFHTINVREYGIELGDNPAVTAGPPLTIGWEYEDVATLPVEDYESQRGKRRFKDEMHIPAKQRESILLQETDNTKQEISERISTVRKSRSQRQHTVALLDFEDWHVVFETIGRRFRRFRSGISKQREQELLWEEAQGAAAAAAVAQKQHTLKNDGNDELSCNSSSTNELQTSSTVEVEE